MRLNFLAPGIAWLTLTTLAHAGGTVVTFDSGAQGWSINGLTAITPTGGNPDHRIHWDDPVDTFVLSARTSTNNAFLGDYTARGATTLAIDIQVDSIQFFGGNVPRELAVILYDDDPFNGAPAAFVWSSLGVLDGNGTGWLSYEANITDVFSSTLPAGWGGGGDEDPMTFEPILPAGRSWTDVLQGVDRVEFTTGIPGFVFGFTNFDLSIDNVRTEPFTGASFCDAADGSLASCPCGNPGDPDTGCDIQQATGGVKLDLVQQESGAPNRVTWSGSGFPASGTPTAIVIRAATLEPAPVAFGDGLRCVGTPLVRLGAAFAIGGTSTHTHGHGMGAGSGDFHYQLWFRNTPAMFCTPDAFNLSNGRSLTW